MDRPDFRPSCGFLTSAEKLDVLDTTFPQDKPQMLYWNVQSDFDVAKRRWKSLSTSPAALPCAADYLCIGEHEMKAHVGLQGFVRVTNNSGEEYEDAQVRLVVGTINLVEKIAQLAHISRQDFGQALDFGVRKQLQALVTRERVRAKCFAHEPRWAAAPGC